MIDWFQKYPGDWKQNGSNDNNTDNNNTNQGICENKLTKILKLELFYLDPIRFKENYQFNFFYFLIFFFFFSPENDYYFIFIHQRTLLNKNISRLFLNFFIISY